MNKKLLDRIKAKFEERLKAKTGWDRNKIMALYNECVTDALLDMME